MLVPIRDYKGYQQMTKVATGKEEMMYQNKMFDPCNLEILLSHRVGGNPKRS